MKFDDITGWEAGWLEKKLKQVRLIYTNARIKMLKRSATKNKVELTHLKGVRFVLNGQIKSDKTFGSMNVLSLKETSDVRKLRGGLYDNFYWFSAQGYSVNEESFEKINRANGILRKVYSDPLMPLAKKKILIKVAERIYDNR